MGEFRLPLGRMCGLGAPLLVARPVAGLVPSELIQIPPGEQTCVMSVVEDDLDGILSDRLDRADSHVFLTEHQHLLARTVSFHFGGGRVHTQILERQLEAAPIGKTHFEQPGFVTDFDFGRYRVSHSVASIGLLPL
jgi:hypothetical protein